MTAVQGSKLFRSLLARDGDGRDLVRLGRWKRRYAVLLFCVATAILSRAQTFDLLVDFNGTNGSHPVGALVEGTDGSLYGTTPYGGTYEAYPYGVGTAFKITKSGVLTMLHSFCPPPPYSDCSDGQYPFAGLSLANNGSLYGTASTGGSNGDGTVFKIDAFGALTILHAFAGTDGAIPYSGLVQASNGNLYGETSNGGANGYGTIFKMTSAGAVTTIYNFCGKPNCIDGASPGTLVQAADGNLYGTAYSGGTSNMGTVFRITPNGTLTTLHSFDGVDGTHPEGVIQGTDGDFYGTTLEGGTYGSGTVFKITSSGAMSKLYSFCAQANCPDGEIPEAGLIQATDGNFYGVASGGGPNLYYGDVFEITPQGTLTTIYSFCGQPNCMDGWAPTSALVQATDGNFYGVTYSGGDTNGDGTVFRIVSGLSPFLELRPSSGKPGAPIIILGTNLADATGVTFNGTAAGFSVVSDSEIKTTVPAGAMTGSVQVSQASGTVSSKVAFKVKPTILTFSPASGPMGTSVVISGESLSGAEDVSFGGAKTTSFTVNSYTQITATVPARAKTGRIAVNTPGGSAESASSFTITP